MDPSSGLLGCSRLGWAATHETLKSVVAEYVDVSSPQFEILQRWRLFDRGLAEAPALLISRAAADQFVRGSFEPLLVPARGRQQPYLVFSTDGPKGKQATAIAVFRHAPYEVALLQAVTFMS